MVNKMTENTEKKHKKKLSKRTKLVLFALIAVIDALLIAECVYSNQHIEIEQFEYMSDKIPQSFDGFKIVQLSDYHDHGDGFEQKLIEQVKIQQPDIILLTGDLVDSQYTDISGTEKFLGDVSKIAPCYMVWGNHDMRLTYEQKAEIYQCCEENGITLLGCQAEEDYFTYNGSSQYIEKGGDKIRIVGTYYGVDSLGLHREAAQAGDEFVLWLHHFPEDAPDMIGGNASENTPETLLFCGHAHGGLIRLPFIKGIYSPGEGLFPKYTSGEYDFEHGEMIVSRGVGNSGFSLRMFDSFHMVVCTLRCE